MKFKSSFIKKKNDHSTTAFALLVIFLLVGSCKKSKDPAPPNILFAIADDVSYPHMGANGCTWVNTPGYDRVAREGLLFTRAYTPNAKCSPSRACILTGRNSWQLEEAANHVPFFPEKFGTFMEALQANGYHTGHTAKGWAPGNAGLRQGKKRELTGPAYNDIKLTPPTAHISNIDYAANFNAFLTERDPDQPFCFWYGSLEPHRRYEYGTGVTVGGKSIDEVNNIMDYYPDNETVRNDLLDYALEIEHFDQHLQKMLATLADAGELDNTLIVVTADNGMPFPRAKGQTYEFSNHLPLAMMWPKGIVNPGRTIDDIVSFIDFAPTFLEAAGVDALAGRMEPITGQSLLPFIRNAEEAHEGNSPFVLMGKERHDIGRPSDWGYPTRAVLQGNLLLIKNFEVDRWPAGNPETGYLNTDGGPIKTWILNDRRSNGKSTYWDLSFGKRPAIELYKIDVDPSCVNNLAHDENYAELVAEVEEQLLRELRKQGDPRALGQGDLFDNYPYANTGQSGFYEKFMQGDLDSTSAGWVNPSDFEREVLD
ncbi:MAG: sulfatase [Saprospiraceae bacterium]|nr:sulfatase [Saprospiraceae bacterium]